MRNQDSLVIAFRGTNDNNEVAAYNSKDTTRNQSNWNDQVLATNNPNDPENIAKVRAQVAELTKRFPVYG